MKNKIFEILIYIQIYKLISQILTFIIIPIYFRRIII